MRCVPGLAYSCHEKGVWTRESIPQIQIACIVEDDPRWGSRANPGAPISDTDPIAVCPPTVEEVDELMDLLDYYCGDYQDGLTCRYDSLPGKFYTCTDQDWSIVVESPPPPPHIDEPDPIYLPIDPKPKDPIGIEKISVCPDTEKAMKELYQTTERCDNYEPGLTCRYASTPNEWYECDTSSLVWLRGVSDPVPPGPVPPQGPCDSEPEEGAACEFGTDEACYAGYTVRGCTPDTLFCSPGLAYGCSEKGVWYKDYVPQIECISDDPLWGTDCSPRADRRRCIRSAERS